MKKCWVWLVMVAVTLVAVSSCADKAQELSTYWDGHDFTSLDGFDDIDSAEEKFDGYMDLLSKVPHEVAVRNMTEFLDSAAQNVVAYMVWSSWFEPYLHALQSPYRNDALFVAWLDKVLSDKVIDDGAQMEHLARMRVMMDKNKVGSCPQNLILSNENGSEFMLSALSGIRTLLLFVDADCPSCLEALEENAEKYSKDEIRLQAILVNGSRYHLENIRRQLPESILEPWDFAFISAVRLEEEGFYDMSLLPFRMLISEKGVIEQSYH